MKIICGYNVNYDDLLSAETITTLKTRREEALLKFALKSAASPRLLLYGTIRRTRGIKTLRKLTELSVE